jgi:RimJ/RimL family protein N-acetyltransferase
MLALDVDPDAWALFNSSGQGEHFESWWAIHTAEMAAGVRVSFVVRRLDDGQIVGTTSYLNIRPRDHGVEIGSTFYHPEVRGGAWRVELVTDARNLRSQAAIGKLGAVREGVLRKHRLTWTGHVRDTVMFSITEADWPGVRSELQARLEAAATSTPA